MCSIQRGLLQIDVLLKCQTQFALIISKEHHILMKRFMEYGAPSNDHRDLTVM